ncbi:type I methionyl aminopeptidase [Amylibacter sp. SFDW26]|uniref:type I methionyl aminopeptidase n=1 Tax=Amylibacter sp. SFDW26 TaxID=2652722 RepID=UPI00351A002B
MEQTKKPRLNQDGITIHSKEDFEGMRRAGRLAAEVLDMIAEHVVPGVTTEYLDQLCHDYMVQNNSVPATLGYRGYPKSSCISINHVVCHGIPGAKIPKWKNDKNNRKDDTLFEGDILNIDVTCILDGWFGDNSRMYVAGKPKPYAQKLIQVTHDALMLSIDQVKPGNTFGDIGAAIQRYAEAQGYSVVRDFCGHGLGRVFHSAPNVLHYGNFGTGPVLEEGMFFTIEPMINIGTPHTKILSDDWTAITKDKSLSAQFEHSIGVTADGCEIFTLSPKGLFHPTY